MQVFIGSASRAPEPQNPTDLVDAGARYGIAVMGVVAVGRADGPQRAVFRLATRIMAELARTW
ncbi:MAG: hypothetical protein HS117_11020 [Verrucomicrobiaceae bacterium]|nr:hypothetical protein [Verrucomicrobiaceae bacterium]